MRNCHDDSRDYSHRLDTTHCTRLIWLRRTALPDAALRSLAANEKRVVITKDADFVDSFILHGIPPKLLFVTTGNIPNDNLMTLFRTNISRITKELSRHSFIEIDSHGMTIHA